MASALEIANIKEKALWDLVMKAISSASFAPRYCSCCYINLCYIAQGLSRRKISRLKRICLTQSTEGLALLNQQRRVCVCVDFGVQEIVLACEHARDREREREKGGGEWCGTVL